MSKYTTEVRFICEESAGLTDSAGYNSIDSVLDSARDKIFDFDFPIFDSSYRVTLENKILKHYYTREICCETVGLWKHFLCTRLNEIMPYYNQLYKSAVIEFNPMYDVDLTTDYQKVDNGNKDTVGSFNENGSYNETGSYNESATGKKNSVGSTSKTEDNNGNTSTGGNTETTTDDTRKNDHWEYFSDTPEGGINGVADLSYLTNATHITDNGEGSTSTTNSETSSTTATANTSTSNASTTDNTTSNNEKNSMADKGGNNEKAGSSSSNEIIRNTEDYLHHVVGKSAGVSYSKLLKEYRDTFINIDMMIIKDLRDLFMNVW